MQQISNFIHTDMFLLILAAVNMLLLLGFLINRASLSKIKRKNKAFMSKFGSGTDIREDLASYIERVENVEEQTETIIEYCRKLDNTLMGCIQKVGIVRYSAFKDTGSDLSFALALLDKKNDGVVLNGIYSREISNIYAKPIENGKSSYTLSEEEKEALEEAINYKD